MDQRSTEHEKPELGVGMLGYKFMGKAHTNALKTISYMFDDPSVKPELVGICGRDQKALRKAATRFGFNYLTTDWQELISDENIQIFSNGGPNHLHAETSIAAARAGKHVFCEKPLARNADEAQEMWKAVRAQDIKHMTAFNYRFVPAIRQAKRILDRGELGRIYHFRASYLQDWLSPHHNTPMSWRLQKETAGSGVLGDLGSHIIDLGRFLIDDVQSVSALTKTFETERPDPNTGESKTVDVDDAFVSTVEFHNGTIGTLQASRNATGRKNHATIEINGEHGSLYFNLERLNELQIYRVDQDRTSNGFETVSVTGPDHPWGDQWWPEGHNLGWEHAHTHAIAHFLNCIANDQDVSPYGATFEDGYRAARVCDAILESAQTGQRIHLDQQEASE